MCGLADVAGMEIGTVEEGFSDAHFPARSTWRTSSSSRNNLIIEKSFRRTLSCLQVNHFWFRTVEQKFKICNTVGEFDLHRWHETSNFIFNLLGLIGVGRVPELALKMKDNCFAGSLLRILDQTILDFSKSQASRNLLWTESLLHFSSQLHEIISLMVDLQTLPKVLPGMDEISS